jgi:hypothetical protein
MTFVTLAEARAAGARGLRAAAATELRKTAADQLREAASSPIATKYDFFLSHTREDATAINGIKGWIQAEGHSVYVYWAEGDATTRVDAKTAAILRTRMDNCKALIYASSDASPDSKWMPWELGYFDGSTPNRIAIMPLTVPSPTPFNGQEYLGLYPNLERLNWADGSIRLGIATEPGKAHTLSGFIAYGASI